MADTMEKARELADKILGEFTYEDTDAAYNLYIKDSEKLTRLIAAALEHASKPSDGWVLVPREPTEEMMAVGWPPATFRGQLKSVAMNYDAMPSAAPKPPASEGR